MLVPVDIMIINKVDTAVIISKEVHLWTKLHFPNYTIRLYSFSHYDNNRHSKIPLNTQKHFVLPG